MPLLGVIHQGTKKLHTETESKPYLKRYKNFDLTLRDHYSHLCQLYPIYVALEEKMRVIKATFNMPSELEYLLARSECIRKDMLFLKQRIPYEPEILAATQAYIKKIEGIDIGTIQGREELFSHFLVRILGDLFGGQTLKEHVTRLYSINRIYRTEVLSGMSFYEFESGALRYVGNWLNQQTVSDETALVDACNESFKAHIAIFDELESTRLPALAPASKTGFFGQYRPVAVAAVAVAATAALVGTCALTEYCSLRR